MPQQYLAPEFNLAKKKNTTKMQNLLYHIKQLSADLSWPYWEYLYINTTTE